MSTTRRIGGLIAAALALLLGTLFLTASPVAAAESEGECFIHAVHEAEESGLEGEELDTLVEDGITECRQAPSPILPEVNEIIWGGFGFLVVFAGLAWKGYPAIKGAMNDRTEKIRADIEGAEAAKAEADKVLAEYHSQLADARNEAARILEEARQDADAVKAEKVAAIEPELAEMRQRAAAEIESSKAQALSELRGEITAIALGAAERVVERNLDDETNRALIDSYIDSVGAQS
ncbi:MAG TPA: F0F1 ATP synthase subunit B [Iamia sp.]|nr:F0F1 ATP synthase subunit B [Iamia sp.]